MPYFAPKYLFFFTPLGPILAQNLKNIMQCNQWGFAKYRPPKKTSIDQILTAKERNIDQ